MGSRRGSIATSRSPGGWRRGSTRPPISIVCFRYAPPSLQGKDDRLDALNKAVMERVQAGGEAFVSGTTIGGRFALRACVLHDGTTEEDIDALVEIARRAGE